MISRDILDKINALVSMLDPKEYDKVVDIIDSIIDDILRLYGDYYKLRNDNAMLHEERKNQTPQSSRDEHEEEDEDEDEERPVCYDERDYSYGDFDPRFLDFGDNTLNSTYQDEDKCEDDYENANTYHSYNESDKDIKINYCVDKNPFDDEPSRYMIHNINVGMRLTNLEKVKYAIKFILEDYIYNLDIDIYRNFKLTELVIGKKMIVYMCEFAYHLENDDEKYTLHDYYEFMQKGNTVTLTKPNTLLGFEDINCKVIDKGDYNYEFKIYHKKIKEDE